MMSACAFAVVLILLSLCEASAASDNNITLSSDGNLTNTQAKSSTTSTKAPSQPRADTTEMIFEYANLNDNEIRIDDSNFKTLVRHCLKSHDEKACDGMAHWDISRVKDCSQLFWEPTSGNNDESGSELVLLKGADTFNVDISGWNTSSCTTMESM